MRTAFVAALLACLGSLGAAGHARADADFDGARVIFARGGALHQTDPRGRQESELVKLPTTGTVRALRTDANGTVLLADIGGSWWWMPLDGTATALRELPCADGPAQLAVEGTCVLCRSRTAPASSVIISLRAGKLFPVAIPTLGARLTGVRPHRKLVWPDGAGVWSSPPGDPRRKTAVAPEPPLRSFLPSPDGSRGVGVYEGTVHVGKASRPAELLMNFALDGQAARRKAIKEGIPIEWSHDSRWVLVQDRGSACIMGAVGGQYKCWKGYTGASIAHDGRWALILGNRKGSDADKAATKAKSKAKAAGGEEPAGEAENSEADDGPADDVEVPLPEGPLSLYRAELEGAFTKTPALVVTVVDGAAVWVPARR